MNQSEHRPQPRTVWSIVTALTWGFASLTVAAVATVLYLSLQSGLQNSKELVAEQCALLVDSVTQRVDAHLKLIRTQTEHLARLITTEHVDRNDREELVAALTTSLSMAPQIVSLHYLDSNARGVRVDRFTQDIAAEIGDWSHQAAVMDAVREARGAFESYWGRILYIPGMDDAAVNIRVPLHRNGEYIGVLVATVTTRELSRYLDELSIPHQTVAFVLLGKNDVLAHPNLLGQRTTRSESLPLPRLDDVDDPVLRQIWSEKDASRMPVLGEPGTGLTNVDHRVLVYTDLRRRDAEFDTRPPAREIELHLTGNMERYMWSFDGKKFSEVKGYIEFKHGERLRLVMVNDTMMEHPMHLHGMWMELENGQGDHLPRKHTVSVKPAERLSVLISADAPGRWAFHCHLLYHMDMGMFRVVRVS